MVFRVLRHSSRLNLLAYYKVATSPTWRPSKLLDESTLLQFGLTSKTFANTESKSRKNTSVPLQTVLHTAAGMCCTVISRSYQPGEVIRANSAQGGGSSFNTCPRSRNYIAASVKCQRFKDCFWPQTNITTLWVM